MDDPQHLQTFLHSYASGLVTVHATSAATVTKPYLISHPMPGNISAIKISIASHDQGWKYTGTWVSNTWFDATILRPMISAGNKGKSRLQSAPILADTVCCGEPSELSEELKQQHWKLVGTIPGNGIFRVCVNSNTWNWQMHKIVWKSGPNGNSGARCIGTLKEGDRIVIWARARKFNWANYVQHARIEVTLAEPKFTSIHKWLPYRYDPRRMFSLVDENTFFGSIGTFIDDGMKNEEVLEKYEFQWFIEEIVFWLQFNTCAEDMTKRTKSKGGPDGIIFTSNVDAEPSDQCASCGLPVSHEFFTCINCQRCVCSLCKAERRMIDHCLIKRLIFNQNVDRFVKDGGGVEDATDTTAKKIRNEHYADYEPLDRISEEIRLLHIMPSQDDDAPLSCVTFKRTITNSKNGYAALSYSWGDMAKQQGITVSHSQKDSEGNITFKPFKPLRVTENLFNALKHIRKTMRMEESSVSSTQFWIDALCINQGDNEERAHQVSMMSQIFANASEVLVWIGDSQEILLSLLSMQVLGTLAYEETGPTAMPDDPKSSMRAMKKRILREKESGNIEYGPDDFLRAFAPVLGHAWFERIWVLQEVFRAQGPVRIYAGLGLLCKFATVLFGNGYLYDHKKYSTEGDAGIRNGIPIAWNMLSKISNQHNIGKSASNEPMTLITLFRITWSEFKATDPRDKLFALLGLARETIRIPSSSSSLAIPARLAIDYAKPISEVFCDFTVWCIEHYRNLDVLSVVGETNCYFNPSYGIPLLPDEYDADHPSWALWHQAKLGGYGGNLTFGLKNPPFDVSDQRDVDITALRSSRPHALTLKGLRVGAVKSIKPGVFRPTKTVKDSDPGFYLFDLRSRRITTCSLIDLWGMVSSNGDWVEGESVHHWLGHSESAYRGDGEAMFRDFLETVMLRTPEPGARNIWEADDIAHKLALYWKRHDPELQSLPPSVRKFMEPLATESPTQDPADGFWTLFSMREKALFMSDEWRLGLCPPETETGDVIVVLFGGKVPFILRPKQSAPLRGQTDGQEWVFVGECFVHGRMHSGVVDEKLRQNVPVENFHLV